MGASMKVTGLDEFQKKINRMADNASAMHGTHSVSFESLFTSSFMKEFTSFNSMQDFLDSSGFRIESQEDFEAIDDEAMDQYVARTTKFDSWENMMGEAAKQYAITELFK